MPCIVSLQFLMFFHRLLNVVSSSVFLSCLRFGGLFIQCVLYFGSRPLSHVRMGSSFYTNGRRNLCPRQQRGGTMLNAPIGVHVLFCEPSFQLSISVCFIGCCRTPRVSLCSFYFYPYLETFKTNLIHHFLIVKCSTNTYLYMVLSTNPN